MRIHEVLEACVEYVALEGVLGSDALSLQLHLAKKDASLDATSFAYLYTLLCRHPSIRIAISTVPLPSADGSVQLGTAPLPEGYAAPDSTKEVDFDRLYREGKRGRELAYHLAGEDFVSSRQAIDIKRAEQDRVRQEKKVSRYGEPDALGKAKGKHAETETGRENRLEQILGEDGSLLMSILDEDDEDLGGDVVEKSDLAGLAEKWGSRLRIRCTQDEIYYRLTGSHQKIPKLTAAVLHTLQLAARSREKGITAIELGPLIGASQGTMHYYMKVLLEMGLCAKVPAVLHGSVTNLLLFHKFLHLNDNYRAIKKLGPLPAPAMAPIPASSAIDPALLQPAQSGDAPSVEDSSLQVTDENGEATASDLAFRPMTEAELMTGHLVKERLIAMLDHPGLQNHLLKCKNLLALIGGPTISALRHRRAIPRHIAALVMDGVIERLEVGPKLVDCLRLTKYNPNYTGPPKAKAAEPVITEDVEDIPMQDPKDFTDAFQYPGGIALNLTFERQITDIIIASGKVGMIYTEMRNALDGAYKRAIEFYLLRAEDSWVPPQMRGSAICSVMESAAKERRLRVFSVESYRAFMLENGTGVDDKKHPALTEDAGRWNNLYFRSFAKDTDDFWRRAESVLKGRERKSTAWSSSKAAKSVKAPKNGSTIADSSGTNRDADGNVTGKRKYTRKGITSDHPHDAAADAAPDGDDDDDDAGSDDEPRRKLPRTKYEDSVQQRGRPRKYIHVVDEDGKVNRRIIGQVLPVPSIPPVLIYVKRANKLVSAPEGYSGLGKPPTITADQLKQGHTPAFYNKFAKVPKSKGQSKGKGRGKKGKEAMKAETEGGAAALAGTEADVIDLTEKGDEDMQEAPIEVDELDSDNDKREQDRPDKAAAAHVQAPPTPPRKEATPALEAVIAARAGKRARREKSSSVVPVELERKRTTRKSAASAAAKAKEQLQEEDNRGADHSTGPNVAAAGVEPLTENHAAEKSWRTVPQPAEPIQPAEAPPTAGLPTSRHATPLMELEDPAQMDFDLPAADFGAVKAQKHAGKKGGKRSGSRAPESLSTASALDVKASPVVQTPPPQNMTPLPPVDQVSVAETALVAPDPPHRESTGTPAETATPKPRVATELHGRVDFALIRRLNELCEALRVGGGVLSDTKFLSVHRDWTLRVAGTKEPFAPTHSYRMDRRVFKLSLTILEREGRIKITQCAIPTTTGRWIQQVVVWLPDLPKEDVDAYISNLTQATMSAIQIPTKRGKRTQIEDQAFTEATFHNPATSSNAKATHIKPSTRVETPGYLRRNALLKQPGVGAALLGYISARWLRVQRFFDALKEAMANSPSQSSKVSQSPAIFALPLIFEDIPVGTFYQCIFSTMYDEDLDEWLQKPENRIIRLRDVPQEFRPLSGGFAGNKFKAKYRTILTTLVQLGISTPLLPSGPEAARLTVSTTGGPRYFIISENITQATHFMIHDFAPIYHIAADTAGLLGVLPIMQADERARFWSALRDACLNEDINALQPLDCHTDIGLPRTAAITETLQLDPDTLKMMRSHARWRTDTRILPEQRVSIDDQIDWRTGNVKITTEEDIQTFAYNNALSVRFVRSELARRSTQARDRAQKAAKKQADAAKEVTERRQRNQRSLRQKLVEIRQTARKAWEERIMKAAAATAVPYTDDLVRFVTHHTLSVPNRAKLGDKALEDAVKLCARLAEAKASAADNKTNHTGQAAAKKKDFVGVQALILEPLKGTRRRHKWSLQDDELLLDAEAIIRARSRGRIRARQAMTQVFPDIGHQPILTRIKKLLLEPGKLQYFERLEQAWYDLWTMKRGTPELVDDTPDMPQNFDLKHHIDYLREHIKKSDLRLGIIRTAEVKVADLPAHSGHVLEACEWTYGKIDLKTIQDVTEREVSDESKSLGYAQVPLRDPGVDVMLEGSDRKRGLLRACLKMTVSTPNAIFDPALAKALLATFPLVETNREIQRMTEEKTFTRQHNGGQTSRMFAYTATWNHLTEGPLSAQIMGEVRDTADMFEHKTGEWVDYRGAAQSGDIAVLLEMISDDTAEIDSDIDNAAPIRYLTNTYNTRKLTDEAFELELKVKYNPTHAPPLPIAPVPVTGPANSPWEHAPVADDDEEVYNAVSRILDLVNDAGPDGLTRIELLESTGYPPATLSLAYASLAADTPPEAFWAGYDTARLIAVEHWEKWSIMPQPLVSAKKGGAASKDRVCPRRWVDIYGQVVKDDWRRCLDGAVAHVMQCPGLSESELRVRLSATLDRIETNEVLQHLVDSGALRRVWLSERIKDVIPPLEATAGEEEPALCYWPIKPLM